MAAGATLSSVPSDVLSYILTFLLPRFDASSWDGRALVAQVGVLRNVSLLFRRTVDENRGMQLERDFCGVYQSVLHEVRRTRSLGLPIAEDVIGEEGMAYCLKSFVPLSRSRSATAVRIKRALQRAVKALLLFRPGLSVYYPVVGRRVYGFRTLDFVDVVSRHQLSKLHAHVPPLLD